MIRYLSIAGQWCRTNRKLFVSLFVLFVLLSCGLLESVYVLARSSYAPPIKVRAIDIDTRQPISDALVAVVYYTGVFNETSVAVEHRITNDSGVAEFPARMVWAHWLAPDVYTGARMVFFHYYYVNDNPSFIMRIAPYFANPVSIEVEGSHVDRLGWRDGMFSNLDAILIKMPYYFKLSNGPRESAAQIARHYENAFSSYANSGECSVEIERIFRDNDVSRSFF